jgi:hypothetical protein
MRSTFSGSGLPAVVTVLIVLNVGLAVGIIGGELFTVLVLMALIGCCRMRDGV